MIYSPTASWTQESPIGDLTVVVTEKGVARLDVDNELETELGVDDKVYRALEDYFSGTYEALDAIDVDYSNCSSFQMDVYQVLRLIPAGTIMTYGDVATKIGVPKAPRAVGQAVGANPFMLVVPCHRVLAANSIGGFSAGLDRKKILLNHEEIPFND